MYQLNKDQVLRNALSYDRCPCDICQRYIQLLLVVWTHRVERDYLLDLYNDHTDLCPDHEFSRGY